MLTNLKTFWFHHLSKELIFSKTNTNPSSSPSTFLSLENSCDRKQDPLVSSKVIVLSKMGQKALTSKTRYQKKIKLIQPIFLRKECHKEVPYNHVSRYQYRLWYLWHVVSLSLRKYFRWTKNTRWIWFLDLWWLSVDPISCLLNGKVYSDLFI